MLFKNKAEIGESFIIGEGILTRFCSPGLLVLGNKSPSLSQLQLYTYPHLCHQGATEDWVVSHMKGGAVGHDLREMKYEYDATAALWYSHQFIYQKQSKDTIQKIPEKPLKKVNLPNEVKKALPIFGKRKITSSETKYSSEQNLQPEFLYDRNEHSIVAEFFLGKIKNQEVSFLGFEHYEPELKNWRYNPSGVVRDRWSLTGRSYLCLMDSKDNSRLEGNFCPVEQNNIYEATCWVESEQNLKLGEAFSGCYAIVTKKSDKSLVVMRNESQVQRKINKWVYLKISIDLSGCQNNNNISNEVLEIQIMVETEKNRILKVDHIRFSPEGSQFLASVYHLETRVITHRIEDNGEIVAHFYQPDQKLLSIAHIGDEIDFLTLEETHHSSSYVDEKALSPASSLIYIQPEHGFYENFYQFERKKYWIIDDSAAWQIAPGQLHHHRKQKDSLKLAYPKLDPRSSGILFRMTLADSNASVQIRWGNWNLQWERTNKGITCRIDKKIIKEQAVCNCQILISYEYPRLFLWMDGHLLFDNDQSLKSNTRISTQNFDLLLSGAAYLSQVFVFDKPGIRVTYYDVWRRPIQKVEKHLANTAIVTHFIYDENDHLAITTKPTMLLREHTQPLLYFYADFASNTRFTHLQSVWKTGQLLGLVNQYNPDDKGYNYHRVQYSKGANTVTAVGKPGQLFSIPVDEKEKTFITHYPTETSVPFLNSRFPSCNNYTQKQEINPDQSVYTRIFNDKGHIVGAYIQSTLGGEQLVTYEYDDLERLVLLLPPAYH